MLTLAAAACCSQPTSVTIGPAERYLQTLSLSVGQRADITPDMQAQYDSLPVVSSSAVAFLGMDRVALYTPGGPAGEMQVYRFVAAAQGRTVMTLRYTDGTAALQDTIDVRPADPHGAFVQIDAGFFLNTCAVTARGAGYCWGGREQVLADTLNVTNVKPEDRATLYHNTPEAVPGDLRVVEEMSRAAA